MTETLIAQPSGISTKIYMHSITSILILHVYTSNMHDVEHIAQLIVKMLFKFLQIFVDWNPF